MRRHKEDLVVQDSRRITSRLAVLAGLAAASCIFLSAGEADAQIKQPGAHGRYSVELEPHALLWWGAHGNDYWHDGDNGLGLGLRATIPIVENGFIKSINNSVGIGFGLDWGHWGGRCGYWYRNDPRYAGDCSINQFDVPVVMQWNFYITRVFSVFGEPGLAIRHTRWNWPGGWCGGNNNPYVCDWHDSSTDLEPIFFAGGRLGNENVSFTFRLGWPYASAGVSIFF